MRRPTTITGLKRNVRCGGLISFLALAIALTIAIGASTAQAATEFVSIIDPDNGPGTDYTSLAAWEAANQADLTTSVVLSHGGITGTINDGDFVKGAISGAYGTVIHCTATQIAIKEVTGTFQNAEQIDKTDTLGGTATGNDYVISSSAPDSIIAVASCRSSNGTADTDAVIIDGWTTSANNYIKIWTDPSLGNRHNGKWDDNKYRLETTNDFGIVVMENFVRIEGLQVKLTNSSGEHYAIRFTNVSGAELRVSKCIIRGEVTGGTYVNGIYSDSVNANSTLRAWNNVIYGFTQSSSAGIYTYSSGITVYAYNNTVYNCYWGYRNEAAASFVCRNCISQNPVSGDGFNGVITGSNNCSDITDDAPGENPQTGDVIFVDEAGGDFHLASNDTIAKDKGIVTGFASEDIDGDPRRGSWDIGADEYTVEVVRTIRASQTISSISRSSGVVSVTLSSNYPNNNLKVGQTIVIKGVDDPSFDGRFIIASVIDQANFTYNQAGPDATSSGGVAGGDYSSLSEWEADYGGIDFALLGASDGDLVTAQRIAIAECYNDWENGLDDVVNISGWTANNNYYIKVYTPLSERHKGVAETGFYLKPTTSDVNAITVDQNYVKIVGIMINNENLNTYNDWGIAFDSDYGEVSNCLIYGGGNGGIIMHYADYSKCYNNIVYNCSSIGISLYTGWAKTDKIYNCTVYNCGSGIRTVNSRGYRVIAKNNISIGNDIDFDGEESFIDSDYNISSDGSAPGEHSILGVSLDDIAFVSTASGAEDLHIQATSIAKDRGFDLSDELIFYDDIDGHPRSVWDIGADEVEPTSVEFVCKIRSTDHSDADYNTLSSWEQAIECDLTATTTKVFSHSGIVGEIPDGSTVVGEISGATGTVKHATFRQILITDIVGTFQEGEKVKVDDDNYVVITDSGYGAIAVAKCYNDWPTGLEDSVDINGWTTDADHYVKIYVPKEERHTGKAKNSDGSYNGFAIKNDGSTTNHPTILIETPYTKIDGVIVDSNQVWAAAGIGFGSSSSGTNSEISNCIVLNGNVASDAVGFFLSNAGSNIKIYNCIAYGYKYGFKVYYNTGVFIYNCTSVNNDYGFHTAGTGLNIDIKNCLSSNNTESDFSISGDTVYINYCASSDGTADDFGGEGNRTYQLFKFVDEANDDFHLSSDDTSAKDKGVDLSNDPNLAVTFDIDGERRIGTWDIGADKPHTDFVCKIRATVGDGTNDGDYSTLSSWEASNNASLNLYSTMVFEVTDVIGSISDGATVTLYRAGASTGITATVLHLNTANSSPRQIALKNVSNPRYDFTAGDVWQVGSLNYVVIGENFDRIGISIAEIYNDWPSGYDVADKVIDINGWTTNDKHYVKLYVPPSQRHTGIAQTGFYINSSNVGNYTIIIREDYTVLDGLEIQAPSVEGTVIYNTSSFHTKVKNCIVHNVNAGVVGGGSNTVLENCIFYDFGYSSGGGALVIWGGTLRNCTIYADANTGAWNGQRLVNSATCYNVIGYNETVGGYGDLGCTGDYNISSDTSAPGLNSLTSQTLANIAFVSTTPGEENFHLTSSSVAIDKGANLSSEGFSDDIDNQTRPGSWDIGADEYIVPASISSANNQVFIVGDPATAIAKITVTANEASQITADKDIYIRIPSSFNMSWDITDTTAVLEGTASGKAETTVSYVSPKVLRINVTEDFASGETLIISGLSFTDFTAPSTSDNLELCVDGGAIFRSIDDKTITIGSNISSNGTGGGNWSEAATWSGGAVPGVNDRAVIAGGDTVIVDKVDTAASCAGITVEANGLLEFDTSASRTLIVAGDIYVDGTLRMRAGAEYTSTIQFDCETNGQYGLIVTATGLLDIEGTSKSNRNVYIAALTQDESHNAYIWCQQGSETHIKYADISYMGLDEANKNGITVYQVDGSSAGEGFSLEGSKVHDGYDGIHFTDTATYCVIKDNDIFNNSNFGIYLGGASVNNNIITGNKIYSSGYRGILLNSGSYNLIYGNIIADTSNAGVYLGGDSNYIFNNTIVGNGNDGIWVLSDSNIIKNNLIAYTPGGEGIDDDGTGTVIGYNLFYGNTLDGSTGTNAITGSAPNFYNFDNTPAGNDNGGAERSVSSATSNTLTASSPGWTTNQWAGYTVWVDDDFSSASGSQFRYILSNTADTLTIAGAWSPTPDNTYKFKIINFEVGANSPALGAGCQTTDGAASSITNIGAITDLVISSADSNKEYNSLQLAHDNDSTGAGDTLTTYANDLTSSVVNGSVTNIGNGLYYFAIDKDITTDYIYNGYYLYVTAGADQGKYYLITDTISSTDTLYIFDPDMSAQLNDNDAFTIVDRVYTEKSHAQANFMLSKCGANNNWITWDVSGTVIVDAESEKDYNCYAGSGLDKTRLSDSIKLLNYNISALGGDPITDQSAGYYDWGDATAPSGLADLAVSGVTSTSVTLTWTAATDTYFNHYEIWYGTTLADVQDRTGTAAEWDNSNDVDLASAATATTTVTGLTSGLTYYFKIWAVDDAGNEATTTYTSVQVDNPPFGGYTADNVIPAAQCVQAADGSGDVTISFRVKDADLDACSLKTFEYSVDGGTSWTAPGDSSGALSAGWTDNNGAGYASAADWTGTVYSFTFNTKHTDLSGLDDVDQSDVRIRFTVNDSMDNSAQPATSESFQVDNLDPTLSSWDLDMNTRKLTLNFSESVAAANFTPSGVILQDNTVAGTSYTLTSSTTASSNGTSIVVDLSDADFNAIAANSSLATADTNSYLRLTSAAITDLFGNSVTAIADGSAIQVTTYTADTTAPTLNSWSLDMNAHQIILNFSESVQASTWTPTAVTLQDTATAPTETYTLTAGSTTASANGTQIIVTLSTADFNAIVENTGLATGADNSYLTLTSSAINDMAGNAVTAVTTGMQASDYTANTVAATNFKITTTAGTTMTAGDVNGKTITIKAYDADGYLTPSYEGEKNLIFSGANASPDGYNPTVKDKTNTDIAFGQNTLIDFTNAGAQTTIILYNRETAAIKATDGTVVTAADDDLEITVNPETAVKVVFTQEPSSTGIINTALEQQPVVEIQDTYGNRTDDTYQIKLWDSETTGYYTDAPGTLSSSHSDNTLAATAGQAEFSGVKYDTIGTIYLYAECPNQPQIAPDFSSGITFSVAGTSTVDAAVAPLNDFSLIPTNDNIDEKFAVLKFKVVDAGADLTPTLIDQVVVTVGGTGANASTDIAWAGLYVGGTQVATATGSAITNTSITFGATPNGNSTAELYSVDDNSSIEFTVYIYMKDSKLTATEGDTYTFSINESGIGTDTATSSQMTADRSAVSPVTGTIKVDVTHLEIVDADTGNASLDVTAGVPHELTVRATDANKNVDEDYAGNRTLIFSGLNSIGIHSPLIENTAFGYNITINFGSGESAPGAVTLTAYKAETQNVSVSESGKTYLAHPISITVSSANADNISMVSGGNQSGAATHSLANPFVTAIKDTYGNPVEGTSVSFAISSTPSGASGQSLSSESGISDSNGQVSTTLTLGDTAGEYKVTATATGLSGSPITFTATALSPNALNKISGDEQSGQVTSTLDAVTVKLVDSAGIGIPNETISFSILSYPAGATGQSLSVSQATTDSNGLASTVLTLGDKSGTYTVKASYESGTGDTLTAEFSAEATAASPYQVVLSGPASTTAGDVSAAFIITVQDKYANVTNVSSDTEFLLTTTASATGKFYSDASGTTEITSCIIAAGLSSATFFYKDSLTGTPTLTVTRTSGDALTTDSDSLQINITPAGLSYFTVTGSTTPMTAGDSRTITVSAYDAQGNLKTDLSSMNVYFSGANSSPAPAATPPTCSNSSGADVNFGSPTLLSFSGGQATTTLKLYKAETVAIKAMNDPDSPTVTTSDTQDLDIVVKHSSADHLKFSADIPTPAGGFQAGVPFSLGTLYAVDLYDNLCDGENGAIAYAGTKTVNYTLSGTANSPNGSYNDSYTNTVDFTAGASSTTLTTTLYRAQSTTITAIASDLTGTNVPSNTITVQSGPVDSLSFYQQPSTSCLTNVALAQQPIVAVADKYGNPISSAADQITLSASLTSGSYTAVTNGTLSADSLQVVASEGVAKFSGVKYSYPEAIYLRASVTTAGVEDAYSYQISFSTASDDATMAAGPLEEPATIASTVDTSSEKVDIFDFKVTDAGKDGWGTKITKIVITRDTTSDTTNGWSNYIAGAYLTDGTNSILGTVSDNALTFGDGVSVIYTVSDSTSKTFFLSIYLKQSLPTGADNQVLAFEIDPNDDISVHTLGSGFAVGDSISSSTAIAVTATKFIVTGSASTVTAGAESFLTLKATDVNGNVDADYAGSKTIIFSGASTAASGDVPKCNNVDFGQLTPVGFANGTNSTTLTILLYKAEGASIKATDANNTSITTSDADDWDILVTGGAASQLFWHTQPNSTVVANAPWKTFRVSVTDAYGNISSETKTITIIPNGGTRSPDCTYQVATESGIATFNNFRLYCASYPGMVTLNATASGVTESGPSNTVTVVEKYNIGMKVVDSVTGGPLTEVTLTILDADGNTISQSGLTNPMTGNSPFSFYLPYGTYQFALSKEAYVDSTVEKVASTVADGADNTYDNTIAWTVYMTSIAESLADYRVLSNFVYDEDADKLYVSVRLEKRGQQILSSETMTLQTSTLNIYDSTDPATAMYSASLSEPDSNGVYWYIIPDAVASQGFRSGRSYFAKITILYGSESLSTTYSASTTFDIGVAARLKTWTKEIKTEVSGVKKTVAEQAKATRTTVTSEAATTQAKVASETATAVSTIQSKVASTESALSDAVAVESASRILNQESYVKQNETLTIRYKTDPGLSPTIDVYDPYNNLRIDGEKMTETVPGKSGIYEYDVTFRWGRGEYTIVCKEETKGTLDGINIEVISTSLEDISTAATTTMARVEDIDMDQIKKLSESMKTINQTIDSIIDNIDELSSLSGKLEKLTVTTTETIYKELSLVSEKMKEFSKKQGLKLEEMYSISEEQSTNVDYIKNKTLEIKALVELSQDILSRRSDEPIVKTWMESAVPAEGGLKKHAAGGEKE